MIFAATPRRVRAGGVTSMVYESTGTISAQATLPPPARSESCPEPARQERRRRPTRCLRSLVSRSLPLDRRRDKQHEYGGTAEQSEVGGLSANAKALAPEAVVIFGRPVATVVACSGLGAWVGSVSDVLDER